MIHKALPTEAADRFQTIGFDVDGPNVKNSSLLRREHLMKLSSMWACVAEAMKVGDVHADLTDGHPSGYTVR